MVGGTGSELVNQQHEHEAKDECYPYLAMEIVARVLVLVVGLVARGVVVVVVWVVVGWLIVVMEMESVLGVSGLEVWKNLLVLGVGGRRRKWKEKV